MLSRSILSAVYMVGSALAATTTIVNPAISATPSLPSVPTSTDLKGDITFLSKDTVINVPEIPAHVNITCKECSSAGIIELAAGGYNANDSAMGIATEFFEHGFMKFQTHGVKANMTMEVALAPGFQLANFKLPLFKKRLFTLPMGQLGDIDIFFEIFIPIILELNSEVDIIPSLTLEVPDTSVLYLDFGNENRSFITGFNESKLTPNFDVNAPNLSFTMLTGLDFLISANTTVGNSDSVIDFTGDFIANLGLPILNTTLTELHKVNGTCDPPKGTEQVYDTAVGVQYSAKLGLDLSGQLAVSVGNFSESWAPPAIDVFNRTFPMPTSCFKFDPASNGLIAATATPSATADGGKAQASGKPNAAMGLDTPVWVVAWVGLGTVAAVMVVL